MSSPDARAARIAERLGSLSLSFSGKLRGRKRPDIPGLGQPELIPPEPLEVGKVRSLGKKLDRQVKPLFDRFTRHNRFALSEEGLRAYCDAPATRKRLLPADPTLLSEAERAALRRPQYIRDKVQQELLDDRNIARIRRYSLKAVQFAIKNDVPIDEQARVMAADAITDFGYGLHDNPKLIKIYGQPELDVSIIRVGIAAQVDEAPFRENPDLLRMVQREQAKRDRYWGDRYDLAVLVYDGRLTEDDQANNIRVETEVARLQALCQS